MFGNERFGSEFEKDFADGEVIFHEGEESRDLYIIQYGEIVIRKKTDHGDATLVTFKKGDVVGEMALLESLPRYASAFAKGSTRVLVIKPGGFLLKIRRDPTFAFELLQHMSWRIRATNERLLESVKRGKVDAQTFDEILQVTEARDRHLP